MTLKITTSTVFILLGPALAVAQDRKPLDAGAVLDVNPKVEAHNALPPEVQRVKVSERIGTLVNKNLMFTDHTGQRVTLGQFFDGQRPVLLSLNYYNCPTLCSLQLNAYAQAMGKMDWLPGKDFQVVTVSINPENTTEMAATKRQAYLDELNREGVQWHFLLDDKKAVEELAQSLGFEYSYDERTGQYAHGAVSYVLTPEGKIARYLYGISPSVRDLKFALMDASEGRLGTTVERFVLNCFHFDTVTGRYTAFAMGTMRWGGAATVFGLGLWLSALWVRDKRRRFRETFA
jgi:protein SCO1/2